MHHQLIHVHLTPNPQDSAVWLDYLKLFDESRLVHVTTLDFALCTALAPFWMDNDATARNWDKRWVNWYVY